MKPCVGASFSEGVVAKPVGVCGLVFFEPRSPKSRLMSRDEDTWGIGVCAGCLGSLVCYRRRRFLSHSYDSSSDASPSGGGV